MQKTVCFCCLWGLWKFKQILCLLLWNQTQYTNKTIFKVHFHETFFVAYFWSCFEINFLFAFGALCWNAQVFNATTFTLVQILQYSYCNEIVPNWETFPFYSNMFILQKFSHHLVFLMRCRSFFLFICCNFFYI